MRRGAFAAGSSQRARCCGTCLRRLAGSQIANCLIEIVRSSKVARGVGRRRAWLRLTGSFAGLSGLGDLTVTCYSRLSRNRMFGEQLGRGQKPEEIVTNSVAVAEGYPTARSAYQLAHKLKISTPIIDEVYSVLYEGKNVARALQDLVRRETKAED